MSLPLFRYHPDPIASGSVAASDATCRCCGESRGFLYTGPVYSEEEPDDSICPWCNAGGEAQRKFDAAFVDSEAFDEGTPESAMEEICRRTPGFNAWQSERWPVCCGDATAFIAPAGIPEIRQNYRELAGSILSHIIHDMKISGGAATRLLQSLDRDKGPAAFLFRCLHCEQYHVYVDSL